MATKQFNDWLLAWTSTSLSSNSRPLSPSRPGSCPFPCLCMLSAALSTPLPALPRVPVIRFRSPWLFPCRFVDLALVSFSSATRSQRTIHCCNELLVLSHTQNQPQLPRLVGPARSRDRVSRAALRVLSAPLAGRAAPLESTPSASRLASPPHDATYPALLRSRSLRRPFDSLEPSTPAIGQRRQNRTAAAHRRRSWSPLLTHSFVIDRDPPCLERLFVFIRAHRVSLAGRRAPLHLPILSDASIHRQESIHRAFDRARRLIDSRSTSSHFISTDRPRSAPLRSCMLAASL